MLEVQSRLVITTLWNHSGSLRDAEDDSKAAVASRWPHLPYTLNTVALILILRADQMSATFINTAKPIWRWISIGAAQINDDVKHRYTNLPPKHIASIYVYITSCYVISQLYFFVRMHISLQQIMYVVNSGLETTSHQTQYIVTQSHELICYKQLGKWSMYNTSVRSDGVCFSTQRFNAQTGAVNSYIFKQKDWLSS